MSDLKMISPLLNDMVVEREISSRNGCACYVLRQQTLGESYVLKLISIPSSESKVAALVLSGAYADRDAVHEYYTGVAKDITSELESGKLLSQSGHFAGALAYQIEKKESGVGFDIYILYPRFVSLSRIMAESAMTHLRALNLGIDLCDALAACREAGFLFENLKPENVFLTPSGRFLPGDLGLAPTLDLQYASMPEDYLSPYTAPELFDIAASPNLTADIYSLGMLLYRIYNGNHGPFEDENTGEQMAEKLRLSGKPLPTPLYADYEMLGIIHKACDPKPENRYQTPEELKQDLVLYMQRNEVSDVYIVPPIVVEESPVELPAEPQEEAPIRMADAEALEADFRQSFAPDFSGAGTEADVEAVVPAEPSGKPVGKPASARKSEREAGTASEVASAAPAEPVPASDTETESAETSESASEKAAAPVSKEPAAAAESASGKAAAPVSGESAAASESASGKAATPVSGESDAASESASEETAAPVSGESAPVEASVSQETAVPSVEPQKPETAPKKHKKRSVKPKIPTEAASESQPEKTPEEKKDDNFDALLASISDAVKVKLPPQPAPLTYDEEKPIHFTVDSEPGYVDEEEYAVDNSYPESPHAHRARNLAIFFGVIAALCAALYFAGSWFFVEVSSITAVERTTDSLTISLETSDNANHFVVRCTDQYGTSYPGSFNNNQIIFSGLSENTNYTISISPAKYHYMTPASTTLHSFSTAESTRISEFNAVNGEKDGDVEVSFLYDGPAPDEWTLEYASEDGTDTGSIQFSGHQAMVSGLNLGQVYTFTLKGAERIYLEGEVSKSLKVLPKVIIASINVSDLNENTATVEWLTGANQPPVWKITCSAEGMDAITAEVTEPKWMVELPDFKRDYTFTVTADGMSAPIQLLFPANPIIVESFSSSFTTDGTLELSWQTMAGAPAGGWFVSYEAVGSQHEATLVEASGNSVELKHLIPEAEYKITLRPADGSAAFGQQSTTLTTPAAQKFEGYGLSPRTPYISFWPEPSYSGWTYRDLRNYATSFSKDTPLAICLEVSYLNSSSDTVFVQYVVRNSEGVPINDSYKTVVWNEMWNSRRHASAIPSPGVPGEYTLDIYINGQSLLSAGFTITE